MTPASSRAGAGDALLLAADVGGTHARAVVVPAADATGGAAPLLSERTVVRGRADLLAFLGGVCRRSEAFGPVRRAALAMAGPVEGRRQGRMTNWTPPNDIALADLAAVGLPAGDTLLLNDLEAGCYGLAALVHGAAGPGDAVVTLRPAAPAPDPVRAGNLVFVAPGTGLGSAGIVAVSGAGRETVLHPCPCEIQHAVMPAIDADHGRVMDHLERTRGGRALTWEDLVSGPGLVAIHRAVCALAGTSGGDLTTAQDVARAALDGQDGPSRRALSLYYRCAGRFAQLLALAFQPTGGVYLGGASTRANRALIADSGFAQAFDDNRAQAALLRRFPLRLCLDEDVNLRGALRVAALGPDRAARFPG